MKDAMKVAYLTTDLSRENGWGRYSYELIKRMPARGIEPVVLVMPAAQAGELPECALYPMLCSFSDGLLKPVRIARDWLAAQQTTRSCSLIHCLAEPFMPLAWLLSSRSRPFAVTVHGTYALSVYRTCWKELYRRAYAASSRILSVSRYTAQQVERLEPGLRKKIHVVPNGADTDALNPAAPPSHLREPAFLMVGHVKPRKGMLQAVEALALVVRKYPRARLYIAGSLSGDAYVGSVKERIAAHGIGENVKWLGRVSADELQQYYKRVRALVMPSMNVGDSFEGFGLVHLEANVQGVPAIGSLGCGNEDAIRDGYSGFLIEQGNIRALSDAMLRLIDPGFDWDGMSANALQFARSMSWDYVADSCLSVYNEIVRHKDS